ncbi:MAG: hypothetical protein K2G35_05265, partial [Duncaniella sp.]|nr:hypothetical protein [Duncaniella sp.]
NTESYIPSCLVVSYFCIRYSDNSYKGMGDGDGDSGCGRETLEKEMPLRQMAAAGACFKDWWAWSLPYY